MRVAYLCVDPGVPVFGTKGSSVHVQEVVRAFRERDMPVTVYCTRRGSDVPADLHDLPVVERTVAATESPAERERAIASAAQSLADAAIEDGCDLVYERYSLFSTASAVIARATGSPVILEVNAPLIDEQRTHRTLVDEAGARADTTRVVTAATVVVCVSEPVAAWVRPFTTSPRRITVVANGVNTRRIVPPAHSSVTTGFTVGFIGTLKPWHGVDVLIRATARAESAARANSGRLAAEPPWRLRIVGDGPERAALRQLASNYPLDVEFTGAVAPERVPELLAGFDVAAAPYPAGQDQYFSPLKLYEYLSAGLPVVASAVGQIPTVIVDDCTGLLVPPGDEVALADALGRVNEDRALRVRLGRAARALAVERHDWRAVVGRILDHLSAADQAQLKAGAADSFAPQPALLIGGRR